LDLVEYPCKLDGQGRSTGIIVGTRRRVAQVRRYDYAGAVFHTRGIYLKHFELAFSEPDFRSESHNSTAPGYGVGQKIVFLFGDGEGDRLFFGSLSVVRNGKVVCHLRKLFQASADLFERLPHVVEY